MGQTSVSYLHMPLSSRMDRVVARQASRKTRRWIKWLLLAVLAAGLAFGLWKGALWLLGKTLMSVKNVEVYGLNYLNRDEIDRALEGYKLDNTLDTDAAAIERQLATLDYVSSVKVEKVYPSRLVITITERLPVAYSMQAGNLVALSSDGYPLPVDSRLGAPTMPLLYGEIASENGSGDQVELSRNMLGMLGVIKTELPQFYAQIESVKSSAQIMRLVDGSIVLCGWQNSKEDFTRLCAVRSLLCSQGEKASSFDLRYHNQVIAKGLAGGTTSGGSEAPVLVATPDPPTSPSNQQMLARKDIAPKKPETNSKNGLNAKSDPKKEHIKKTNTSSTTGPKSRAKVSKAVPPKTGKKVGR